MPELHPDRPVEAKLLAHLLDLRRVRGAAGNHAGRIGGQEMQQQEGDGGDAEQDQRGLHQAAGEIGRHQCLPRSVGSSRSRSASPTRLTASASSTMAKPGMNTSQGADWK